MRQSKHKSVETWELEPQDLISIHQRHRLLPLVQLRSRISPANPKITNATSTKIISENRLADQTREMAIRSPVDGGRHGHHRWRPIRPPPQRARRKWQRRRRPPRHEGSLTAASWQQKISRGGGGSAATEAGILGARARPSSGPLHFAGLGGRLLKRGVFSCLFHEFYFIFYSSQCFYTIFHENFFRVPRQRSPICFGGVHWNFDFHLLCWEQRVFNGIGFEHGFKNRWQVGFWKNKEIVLDFYLFIENQSVIFFKK
jgi:hypothetical protein